MKFSLRNIKADARTLNVVKNTFASGIMKVCTLLCSLLIVPITIDYMDNERYGIWMTLSSIIYWFAFMDIGLGNGMRNYMAEAFSKGNMRAAQSYFSTAIFLLTAIGLLICVAIIPLIYLCDLTSILNTKLVTEDTLRCTVTIVAIFSLLQFVAKNIGMVYVAMQKYAVNDLINLLSSICSLIAIYILTKTTKGNIIYVVTMFTSMPVLMYVLSAIPLLYKYPQLKPSVKTIDLLSAKQIVLKGLGFFAIQITSCLVIFSSANIFISHYCGPESATVYNVAYKYFNVLVIAYTIVISPLWNAYTDASIKNDYEWIRKNFKRSLYIWGLSVLGGVVMLALSGWFYDIWVKDRIAIPLSVSASVFAYLCFFNLNNCVTFLINGLNKIRIQIITSITFTVLYIISITIIQDHYGIVGISLSMSVAYLLMALIHLYQCRLLIRQKAEGIWNK